MSVPTSIYAVPENFLDVALDEFLIPSDTQDVPNAPKLSNGKVDVVSLLYNTDDMYQYPTYPNDD